MTGNCKVVARTLELPEYIYDNSLGDILNHNLYIWNYNLEKTGTESIKANSLYECT